MADLADRTQDFGANSWLVEEMYEQFRADPASVSEAWREFFSDYRSMTNGAQTTAAPASPAPASAPAPAVAVPAATPAPAPATPAAVPVASDITPEPIRGVGAAIVTNMEKSLSVPTATSFRNVPARLLEVNRKQINDYRSRHGLTKVSFTHIIAYAIVRAISDAVPNMRNAFTIDNDGKPQIIRNPHVNVGLAVDVDKGDGTRNLVVPVLREADTLSFAGFLVAYDEIIRKVKNNKLTIADFQGANVSITNPGTIGTVQSVPRLMPGQGVIVGVGSIDYPAEFQGADETNLNTLGVSKVVTVTSTYDHRIIQGAESGLFLKRVHELLLGEHNFYDDLFRSLEIPYQAVQWASDHSPMNREETMMHKQMQVSLLVRSHRVRGHLIADLDPLRWKEPRLPRELDPANYGLTIWDLEREFLTGGVAGSSKMKLDDLLGVLRDAYCRTIGVEYMHIQDTDEQRWIQSKMEGVTYTPTLDKKLRILERLNAAEAFEKFLATKYVGTKRFGLEGAESMIPMVDEILCSAADDGMHGVVFGMPHRGRLNMLVNVMGKDYSKLFKEFEGHLSADSVQGSGDVKYHLGAHGTYHSANGNAIDVELAANPSHLETVNGVVLGMVRAKQDSIQPPLLYSVIPVLMHGDAAFAGQGIVYEGLAMSDINGYRVGGTIHLVVNNQIGFTTSPKFARSSLYATDVAKTVQAPIFHVNGDDPEACARVARLAYEYRQKFHKDVVIDLMCYRLHGHNEGDDPSYTQPLMYKAIAEKRSVRKMYVEHLVKRGDITMDVAEQTLQDYQGKLQSALDDTRQNAPAKVKAAKPPIPIGVLPHVNTGVDKETIEKIFYQLTNYPEGFNVHPKLVRQFEAREKAYQTDGDFEWGVGEALAFGSLLLEGYDVRLAGEDSRRGTFSHRHASLVDVENEDTFLPLKHLPGASGHFWVYDSLLSEYAALGFEYGYSHANRNALVLWEGQFGDFVNGAQIVIDQYIVAAEDKWKQENGLVLLLPHGFEGQGPEHSSARIERFLQMCAEDNIQVVNATTAAQYFHVLRRQLLRDVRKPLVIFTPKQPLRMKESRSHISEFTSGSFLEVLDDPHVTDKASVKRVVLCSGKVAHDAMNERVKRNAPVAVVRVEQLYPFPIDQINEVLLRYPNAKEVVWLQEEPENMGPWHFVEHLIWRLKERGYDLRHASRVASGSPATGSKAIHDQEHEDLMDDTFAGL
ncbi:MAG: multifunctional oxoglutarate decarboxylase/oxoglutarate dehydrogenase thiamine pyrophosphate-binding subunit/dihydrolipoyllysine-residue succinyltransferase subunit [Ilumatobacteraceae bacterium]|jgi:2-oxoglutarate decarboxylase|nr:multifunctional oxoglutarate decarboxylase/oxoglutarate dehydrogenase thiamine pyrophosphate-binding subunit/dihydrolipoyllysine-residue succinyltransferase subunit [Ilumatobacteraceae bacterium]